MIKVQCPCGQENELVESPEGLRYNAARHGNGELCHGRCFNCHAPLKELAPAPEATAETKPEPEITPAAESESIKDETLSETEPKTISTGKKPKIKKKK